MKSETKCLRLTLDTKMTFNPHPKKLPVEQQNLYGPVCASQVDRGDYNEKWFIGSIY